MIFLSFVTIFYYFMRRAQHMLLFNSICDFLHAIRSFNIFVFVFIFPFPFSQSSTPFWNGFCSSSSSWLSVFSRRYFTRNGVHSHSPHQIFVCVRFVVPLLLLVLLEKKKFHVWKTMFWCFHSLFDCLWFIFGKNPTIWLVVLLLQQHNVFVDAI